MDLWDGYSRTCLRCGCTVADDKREVHEAWHATVEPEPEPTA